MSLYERVPYLEWAILPGMRISVTMDEEAKTGGLEQWQINASFTKPDGLPERDKHDKLPIAVELQKTL